jgi:hypothetical protein
MRPQLYLHRPSVFSIEAPRLGPQLTGFLAGLLLALAFGAAATFALSGEAPGRMSFLRGQGYQGARWIALIVGSGSCFASVLVASGFGIKLFAILSHRMGWHPILESEGPCRLVQDAPGLWGLRMELSESPEARAPWTPAARPSPASCCLFFRLDEAAAGAVSHLTSPDEALTVRWLDLPLAVGGPALLEVRSPLREVALDDVATLIRGAA